MIAETHSSGPHERRSTFDENAGAVDHDSSGFGEQIMLTERPSASTKKVKCGVPTARPYLNRLAGMSTRQRQSLTWSALAGGIAIVACLAVWESGVIRLRTREGTIKLENVPDGALVPSGGVRVAALSSPAVHVQPENKAATTAVSAEPKVPTPVGVFATNQFNIARLTKRPRQLDYPIEKIVERKASYRDEIVIPGGMYFLTRSHADNPTGARKYHVTECVLKEEGPRKKLNMTSIRSRELEFEPMLAMQLDRHWDSLEGKVAILTLWMTGSGEPGIVRAQILQKFTPKLKPGYGPGQADIDYDVFFVSPEESKLTKGEDSDWQRVGRLNMLYVHYKGLIAAYKRKLQTLDMVGLSAAMNNMYAGMMKGMAADARAQAARQQAISGQ